MMYLIYRLLNSVIFLLVNLTIVMYVCIRMLNAIRFHNKLMSEAAEFNSIVSESRSTLEYIKSNVSQAMEEIKEDIGRELLLTDNLTRLKSEVDSMLRRFSSLEESAIELARMVHNTKNVMLETPADINEEVKTILAVAKLKQQEEQQEPPQRERPRTPKRFKITTTTRSERKPKDTVVQSLTPPINPTSCNYQTLASSTVLKEKLERPRTPVLPEVRLLNETKPVSDERSIHRTI